MLANSFLDFVQEFNTEEKCVQHLASLRWPDGPVCQKCGARGQINFLPSRNRFWCAYCKKQFSVRAHTIFAKSRLPLSKWFAAIWLATSDKRGIRSIELANKIGVTQKTARLLTNRVRQAMIGADSDRLATHLSGNDGMSTDTLHLPMSFNSALVMLSGGVQAIERPEVHLIEGDARNEMKKLPTESVHMVLTDPPYFLDGLDTDWKKGGADAVKGTGSVGGLPVGMKFDRKQGLALQEFMSDVGREWMRLLVPGGFALVFSQPRLAHRIAVALEDQGFEIRDQICWHFTKRSQFKAFKLNHFIERMDISEAKKRQLLDSLQGRRTPQLRPQFEAIILAQKPRVGTFIENWARYGVGLMDARQTLDGKAPSNVMPCEKPAGDERRAANGHLTPKPVKLLEHLIKLFTKPGQTVLDCFLGSGSTAVAAIRAGRICIGIEINPKYIEIARRRIGDR